MSPCWGDRESLVSVDVRRVFNSGSQSESVMEENEDGVMDEKEAGEVEESRCHGGSPGNVPDLTSTLFPSLVSLPTIEQV